VENLAKRGPLATVQFPPTNTRKNLRMMVNPDVDSYAKTLNHRKIIQKTATYWKPNEYQNQNIT